MERGARLPLLAALLTLASGAPSPTAAAVFMTQAKALEQAFPGARIERRTFALAADEARAVEQRAKAKLSSHLVIAYLAWRQDTLAGVAFFDSRTVRTMPAVVMVAVAPDTTVTRVDVLAFHEPPDYGPSGRWLGLFGRRRLNDRLWPGRDIRNLSGATLTTRSITESVRLALALYERVVAKAPAPRSGDDPAR